MIETSTRYVLNERQAQRNAYEPKAIGELVTPEDLPVLLDSITHASPKWPVIEARMQHYYELKHPHLTDDKLTGWMGQIMEAHVDLALYKAAMRNPSVQYRPLEEPVETNHFVFEPSLRGSNVRIREKVMNIDRTGLALVGYAEVDALTLVNDTPVIIESKVGNGINFQDGKALRNARINQLIKPFEELYGENSMGYAVLAVSDAEENGWLKPFEEAGGHYLTCEFPYELLHAKAREMQAVITGATYSPPLQKIVRF